MRRFHLRIFACLTFFNFASSSYGVTRLNQNNQIGYENLEGQDSETEPESNASNKASRRNHYNLRVAVSQASFPDIRYFDAFYGSSPVQFGISSDWQYYSSPYLNLGVGGQFSYLNVGGKQKVNPNVSDPDPSELEDASGKLSLTLLPYQFVLSASVKPFGDGSFVAIDFWLGYEELYFQEVRVQSNTGSSENSNGILRRANADSPSTKSSETSSNKSIINTGWNNGLVLGASINFLINKLEEKSVGSMRRSIGFGAIYVSPFIEIVSKLGGNLLIAQQKSNNISFAHQNIGIAFTFKTAP